MSSVHEFVFPHEKTIGEIQIHGLMTDISMTNNSNDHGQMYVLAVVSRVCISPIEVKTLNLSEYLSGHCSISLDKKVFK